MAKAGEHLTALSLSTTITEAGEKAALSALTQLQMTLAAGMGAAS